LSLRHSAARRVRLNYITSENGAPIVQILSATETADLASGNLVWQPAADLVYTRCGAGCKFHLPARIDRLSAASLHLVFIIGRIWSPTRYGSPAERAVT